MQPLLREVDRVVPRAAVQLEYPRPGCEVFQVDTPRDGADPPYPRQVFVRAVVGGGGSIERVLRLLPEIPPRAVLRGVCYLYVGADFPASPVSMRFFNRLTCSPTTLSAAIDIPWSPCGL